MSIYILKSLFTNDVYIGKTSSPLKKRLTEHKSTYKGFIEGRQKHISTAIKILKYSDCSIAYLEENIDKNDIDARERYWIEKYPFAVNVVLPTQTQKEWIDKNIEKVRLIKRNYANSARGKQKRKEYLLLNKDKLKEKDKLRLAIKWTCPYCDKVGCEKYKRRHLQSKQCVKRRNAMRIIKRFFLNVKKVDASLFNK
jgi:hypothetical protein